MTIIGVRAEPMNWEAIKLEASAMGITKVGRGHSCWPAREMKDWRSRNIPEKGSSEVDDSKRVTGDLPLVVVKLLGDTPHRL